jgi:hypothetical protein
MMMVTGKLSSYAKQQLAKTFGSLLDGGDVVIFDGDMASSPDAATINQRILIKIPLPDPAFKPVKNGKMAGNFIGAPTKAVATGHASWCRCYDRKGNTVVDGTAGDGEDFFCSLTSSYIEQGGTVLIKSMTYHV